MVSSLRREEETPLNNPWLYLSQQKNVVGALCPVSQNAWGHGRQTLSTVEKLPQKSVTNKERKRKELCLPLNEAKNGKRVWCRSGTQPAFSKRGRLNFPTSSQRKTTFKTTAPPPSAARSFILSHGRLKKGCILPASLSFQTEILWTTGKRGKMGERKKHPRSSFGSVGIAHQIDKAKDIKLFNRIP